MKGNSKIKRIVIAFVLVLTLVVPFSVSAAAEEIGDLEEVGDISPEAPTTDEGLADSGEAGEGAESGENIFEKIYEELSRYGTEILSALTLIGTLIIGFAYKKGLLPLVTRAINAAQGVLTKLKDKTDADAKATHEGLDAVSERLANMENSVTLFADTLTTLEEKLACETEYINERKRLCAVMSAQVDMLYDIFMASALPQYQKDAVGSRIQSMREELSAYEKAAE